MKTNGRFYGPIHNESSVFIDGIAAELMERGTFCYTVQYAIGCLERDMPMVKGILERHLTQAIGF